MKTLNLLTGLPVFLLLVALAPLSRHATASAPVPTKVAADLTKCLRNEIAPLKPAQVETMNAATFETWLRQTTLPNARKKTIRQYLQPVLKSGKFEALLVKKATVLKGNYTSDIAIVRVPGAVKNLLQGSSYVILFADDGQPSAPVIESCQYNSCYCSGNSPGLCTTATQFNKNCPPNECPVPQGSCDCGGSGGGTNLDQVFETVYG